MRELVYSVLISVLITLVVVIVSCASNSARTRKKITNAEKLSDSVQCEALLTKSLSFGQNWAEAAEHMNDATAYMKDFGSRISIPIESCRGSGTPYYPVVYELQDAISNWKTYDGSWNTNKPIIACPFCHVKTEKAIGLCDHCGAPL